MIKRINMLKKCLLLSCAFFSGATVGQIVVKDTGNTVDISEYLGKGAKRNTPKKRISLADAKKKALSVFPLKATLALGKVTQQNWPLLKSHNVALVGVDKVSVKWLMHRMSEIKKNGAIIIVIDVKDYQQFEQFKKTVQSHYNVIVTYGDSSAFEKYTNAYPVLLTTKEVLQ